MTKLSVNKILSRAHTHLKKGEQFEAERLYLKVLKGFPENKKAKQGLAKVKKSRLSSTTQDPPREMIEELMNFYN